MWYLEYKRTDCLSKNNHFVISRPSGQRTKFLWSLFRVVISTASFTCSACICIRLHHFMFDYCIFDIFKIPWKRFDLANCECILTLTVFGWLFVSQKLRVNELHNLVDFCFAAIHCNISWPAFVKAHSQFGNVIFDYYANERHDCLHKPSGLNSYSIHRDQNPECGCPILQISLVIG